MEEHWLREELLSRYSELLKLPTDSTFAPLLTTPTIIPLASGSPFSSHETLPLPCDYQTRLATENPSAVAHGCVDLLHRFTLRPELAAELNPALTEWALFKESKADLALATWSAEEEHVDLKGKAWVDAWLAEGPSSYESGVRLTNVGGYQSQDDAFVDVTPAEGATTAEAEELSERQWGCRQLHRVCSMAMQVLGSEQVYPDDAGGAPPHSGGQHAAARAWFNVNRGASFNTIHVHDMRRWSAVYFVADGMGGAPDGSSGEAEAEAEAEAEESDPLDALDTPHTLGSRPPHLSRHLIFRGGLAPPQPSGSASKVEASHCYVAAPPTPGTLWLFPGSVPHCVLGDCLGDADDNAPSPLDRSAELDCDEVKPDEAARISVAVNFSEAKAPLPTLVA